MDDVRIPERYEDSPEDSNFQYRFIRMGQGKIPLKTKLLIGTLVIGGAAAGVFLFLFFLTLFLYLFLPAILLLTLWNLFKRRR